jgi:hypothetical protein
MTQTKTKSKAKPRAKKAEAKPTVKPVAKAVTQKAPIKNKGLVAQTQAEWSNEMAQLCFRVFFQTEDGNRILDMLETKYFRSPVMNPFIEKNPALVASLKEGEREMIRNFTMWATHAATGKQFSDAPAPVKRKRTAK